MRQIILLVLAIVAGLMAFFASKTYLERQEAKLREQYKQIVVFVAKTDIPVGAKIDENSVDIVKMIASAATRAAIPATEENWVQIKGLPALQYVRQGDAILWAAVSSADMDKPYLSSMLGKGDVTRDAQTQKRVQTIGWRAISIPVDMVASVNQMVVPGDRVDLIGTFTFPSSKPDPTLDTVTLTILQDVQVLATGKMTARDFNNVALSQMRGNAGQSYNTVTLEVTPQEAEMLAFAIRRGGGNLMLALRNREDVTINWKSQSINFEYLEKHINEFNAARQKRLRRVAPDEERAF